MRFRPKVQIDAIQWTGNNLAEVREFIAPEAIQLIVRRNKQLVIRASSGTLILCVFLGDWIVREANGFYSCREQTFRQTFEAVS